MADSPDFKTFYEQELSPLLLPLEEKRKKIKQLGLWGFLMIGLFVLFVILTNTAYDTVFGLMAVLSFIAIIIVWIYFGIYNRKFKAGFKDQVIRKLISFVDEGLEYEPGRAIAEADYKRSGLFQTSYDRYNGDDYLQGTHEKTFFCCSELHTEYRVSTGKSTSWVTIFKGLFFIADFNKNFSGRTYVWTENAPQLNFLSKVFSSFARQLEKVKLESVEFERRFIVYSTDQVEARYILTPSFMERVVRLYNMLGGGVSVSFVQTNINVAISIKEDLFEPSVFSANDYSRIEKFRSTLLLVYDIIDDLRLNDRLWGKD